MPNHSTPSACTSATAQRRVFLQTCAARTRTIHTPLLDPIASRGHPNPAGLGNAEHFSKQGSWGQSSVLFADLETYQTACANRETPYGGAEYGVALTPEADAVCRKMATLHGGHGAILCPSGLAAITTTIGAFAPRALLIPAGVYAPFVRYLRHKSLPAFYYPSDADADTVADVLRQAYAAGFGPADIMLYIEAPASGTFEIPDIVGIAALARTHGIRSVMDNTWASHVHCKPIEFGIDMVIQATTKYEGGYGDTPSGVVIARLPSDFARLSEELRISGNGAVAPTTCARLLQRIDSTATRLEQHHAAAQQLLKWFMAQEFVAEVYSPTLESAPFHARFKAFFSGGNGLFSVAFKPEITTSHLAAFVNALHLFWVGESWGGHVSLVLPFDEQRAGSLPPQRQILRFHAGLEDPQDLLRDARHAAQVAFAPRGHGVSA